MCLTKIYLLEWHPLVIWRHTETENPPFPLAVCSNLCLNSLSTKLPVSSKNEMGFVWQNLLFIKPCWLELIIFLFFSNWIQYQLFHYLTGIAVRLTGLQLPKSHHLHFLNIGTTLPLFPSCGMSLVFKKILKNNMGCPKISIANSFWTLEFKLLGPADMLENSSSASWQKGQHSTLNAGCSSCSFITHILYLVWSHT